MIIEMILLSKILRITGLLILAIFIFILFSGLSSGASNELGKSLLAVIQGIPMFVRGFAIFTFVVSFIAFFFLAFKRQYKENSSVLLALKNIFKAHKLTPFEKLIDAILHLSMSVNLVLNQLLLK